jgi:hypothetical protein
VTSLNQNTGLIIEQEESLPLGSSKLLALIPISLRCPCSIAFATLTFTSSALKQPVGAVNMKKMAFWPIKLKWRYPMKTLQSQAVVSLSV